MDPRARKENHSLSTPGKNSLRVGAVRAVQVVVTGTSEFRLDSGHSSENKQTSVPERKSQHTSRGQFLGKYARFFKLFESDLLGRMSPGRESSLSQWQCPGTVPMCQWLVTSRQCTGTRHTPVNTRRGNRRLSESRTGRSIYLQSKSAVWWFR